MDMLQKIKFKGPSVMGRESDDKKKGPEEEKIITVGPWGGKKGKEFDDGTFSGISEIMIGYDRWIHYIGVVYVDRDGNPTEKFEHGTIGDLIHDLSQPSLRFAKIELKPQESFTKVKGNYGPPVDPGGEPIFFFMSSELWVRSLTFESNVRIYGPYGMEHGRSFSFTTDGNKIVGLMGRCDKYVDAIGFHMSALVPVAPSLNPLRHGWAKLRSICIPSQGEKMAYCFSGFFPKLGSKPQPSKRAKEIKHDVDDQLLQHKRPQESKKSFVSGNEIVDTIMNAMRDSGVKMNGTYGLSDEESRTLVGQIVSKRADDIIQEFDQSFDSRNRTLEKIMEALRDPKVMVIGIYGQGGMGKTTLAREVARRAKEENLFEKVGMISVSRDSDTKKIQSQIADEMGMRLEEENVIGRAQILANSLFRQKKSLVILDDLWDYINLGNVKDPYDDVFTAKILLISRSSILLRKYGDEEYMFPVGVLEEKEAKTLLRKEAGVVEFRDSAFESLVDKFAVKTCALSPHLILSIGSYLRGKSCSQWKIALKMLQDIKFTEFALQDMQFPIEYSFMQFPKEFSSENYQEFGIKNTLLLCAQIGHHPIVMDFVKYFSVFSRIHITLAQEIISKWIFFLEDSKLLDGYFSDQVIMPDEVRNFALSTASSKYNFFTMQNGKLEKWSIKDKLESMIAIILHSSVIINELPEGIHYPQLRIFYLESNDPFLKIPDNFFERMRELQILELIGIQLPILPSSISCLKNLHMLSLERCMLCDNLSIIGELKDLRILSLSGSEIESLPNELGNLYDLELFDISNCPKLKVIPPGVLSRLKRVERFYTRNSPIQWWVEGQENQSQKASLAELSQLDELNTLEIDCPDVAALPPTNALFDELENYKVVIGDSNKLSLDAMEFLNEVSKSLAILQLKEGTDSQEKITTTFKGSVENLLIGEVNGIQNAFRDMNLKEFSYLKHLSIENNLEVQYIINSEDLLEAFPNLESLRLIKLPNMEKILCCNQLADNSFSNLKSMKIQNCGRLKNLFSISLTGLFSKLETLEVSGCHSMEEIVDSERQDNNIKEINIFPKLKEFHLFCMERLTTVWHSQGGPNSYGMLDSVVIKECKNLVTVFPDYMVGRTPRLIKLKIVNCPSIEDIFDIKDTMQLNEAEGGPNSYSMLHSVVIEECKNLVTIFPNHMMGRTSNLVKLKIVSCPLVEEIFDTKNTTQPNEAEVSIFPKLEEFHLSHMERLTTIWHRKGGPNSYDMLDSVIIEECPKLITIFPNHMLGRISLLITLKVVNCQSVEEIFDFNETQENVAGKETCLRFVHVEALPKLKHIWNKNSEGILSFKYLKKVWVGKCPNLKNLIPASMASDLEYIESLTVRDCSMKEIVCME